MTQKTVSASKMTIGETLTGSIVDVKEGKYGAIFVLENGAGEQVTLFPSGNLKFLADDLEKGKKQLNTSYTITRVANKNIKGYEVSQFTVNASATTEAAKANNTVADKLAAIRAKRTPQTAV